MVAEGLGAGVTDGELGGTGDRDGADDGEGVADGDGATGDAQPTMSRRATVSDGAEPRDGIARCYQLVASAANGLLVTSRVARTHRSHVPDVVIPRF
jgi:hypothetical protein